MTNYAGTGEYRLDIVCGPDPDTPQAIMYFGAADMEAACHQAARLLAATVGPDDRYGDLYAHDGDGAAVYCDTIHLPA
ncbi:hypothetical protein [Salinispora arenicola]|uniref:hypothetical protein n=1 Tax=Salinispora arenicola TaxID=168697 RepID=UPI0003A8468E|nr:hypothetical protein [Salinispora arenicola]